CIAQLDGQFHHHSSRPTGPLVTLLRRRLLRLLDQRFSLFTIQSGQIPGAIVAAPAAQRLAHALDAAVDRVHVIQHLTDGTGHRVRHVPRHAISVEADLLRHGLALTVDRILLVDSALVADDDAPRDTYHGRPRRHGLGHHGIGADLGALAYGKGSEYLGAGADHHSVLQGRMALALVPAGTTQGNPLIERDVIADF